MACGECCEFNHTECTQVSCDCECNYIDDNEKQEIEEFNAKQRNEEFRDEYNLIFDDY